MGRLGRSIPTCSDKQSKGWGFHFGGQELSSALVAWKTATSSKPIVRFAEATGGGTSLPEHDRDRHLPTDYVETQCTFAQTTIKPSLTEEFGEFSFTDALMTMQSEMRVGFRDRFIGLSQEMTWTELVESDGAGTTVQVGKTTRTTAAQKKAMRYEPVQIHIVASITGGTPTYYYEGLDYKMLEPTGSEPYRMQWLPTKGLASGTLFTVHYSCRPVWIVDDATYGVQALQGPEEGAKGTNAPRNLPTTFKVKLDFLTGGR